jgi:hypothetical protein
LLGILHKAKEAAPMPGALKRTLDLGDLCFLHGSIPNENRGLSDSPAAAALMARYFSRPYCAHYS